MRLDTFEYIYNKDKPDEWEIEGCQLSEINLIVGRNATGKSRIVRLIHLISMLLSDRAKLSTSQKKNEWRLVFVQDSGKKIEYILNIENGHVTQEKLIISNRVFIDRDKTGEGNIIAEAVGKGGEIPFQTPVTELAAVKRRDTIQHPFLEEIYQWAISVRFYEFGTQLGQDRFANIPEKTGQLEANTEFKNYNYVVSIFMLGQNKFKTEFQQTIISDMNKVGYSISKVGTKPPPFEVLKQYAVGTFSGNPENVPFFIYVQESDLKSETGQPEMSQGMFRVLSLLIQVNYFLMAGDSSCIIIDDIGEGLDYQRSSAIIKVLIEKAKIGSIQLIMTTNDENIMNGVPLEYWLVIERKPGVAKLHNYSNSPEQFEQFKHIGLNNFDFFASEFYLREPEKEEVID